MTLGEVQIQPRVSVWRSRSYRLSYRPFSALSLRLRQTDRPAELLSGCRHHDWPFVRLSDAVRSTSGRTLTLRSTFFFVHLPF